MSQGEQESLVAVFRLSAVNDTKTVETLTAKIMKWQLYQENIKALSIFRFSKKNIFNVFRDLRRFLEGLPEIFHDIVS